MIHCIGDSHSSVFSGNEEMQPIWPNRSNDIIPYFKSYRIGPATAYQLKTKTPIIDQIVSLIPPNDKLLFCFGEVDIRAHLIKQMIEQNRTLESVVKECVDRYFEVILMYKKTLNIEIVVWGPIASWNDLKPYLGGPSFGTGLERNKTTKQFNEYLEKLCVENSIPFISIFNEMLNEDGTTNPIYLDDWDDCHIHLNQKAMPIILKKFKDNNLI